MENKVRAVSLYLNCGVDTPDDRVEPFHRSYYSRVEQATNTLVYIVTMLESKRLPSMNIAVGKDIKEVREEDIPLLDQIGYDIDSSIDQIRGIQPEETQAIRRR